MNTFITKTKEQLSITNGVLNIFVIPLISVVFLSGCTTTEYMPEKSAITLYEEDFNNFVIDCNMKKEQVEFLQSQRRTKTEYINSWMMLPFNGMQRPLTERRNWQIDFLITELRDKC